MKSSLTGLISSSYDISFCVLSLFVSFFGERGHKPHWLAVASFMIGLGALVFSLPQFFSGRYELGSIFEGTVSVRFLFSSIPTITQKQVCWHLFTIRLGLKSLLLFCVNCVRLESRKIDCMLFVTSVALLVSDFSALLPYCARCPFK